MSCETPQIARTIANAPASDAPLAGYRVMAFLNGIEVFGHEKGNIEVFTALRELGAVVKVGVNRHCDGGQLKRVLEDLGFETFLIPFGYQWSKQFFRKHPTLLFICLWRVVASSLVLLRELRRFQPTHLHLGNPLAYSYLAPTLSLTRIPLVYRAGDEPPTTSTPNMLIWKSCMRRANSIVANSTFVLNAILNSAAEARPRSRMIYNRVPRSLPREEFRANTDSLRHIVYVGQIAEHKGVGLLVSAATQIVNRYSDVRFHFVGGSIYSEDYARQLHSTVDSCGLTTQIQFHGQVDDPLPYFEQAILHVAPSVFEEPAANVVLEAKLAGIPSVVFPSGSLPELVHQGIDGLVCASKTVESLVESITWFLDHESDRAVFGQAARHDLRLRFDDDRFVSEWSRVYREVLIAK